MTRGFSFFEEALLVVEAQDQNIEWYMKVAAATQNAIQCYMSSKMRKKKKKDATEKSLDHFPKRADGTEFGKEPLCAINVRCE